MTRLGYIQIEFDQNFKDSLHKWAAESIVPNDYTFGEINGEKIGGLVVDDAHITVCYGIPLNSSYEKQIREELTNITPPMVQIDHSDCFHIREHRTKIIYLAIADTFGSLQDIHDRFKKYLSTDLQTLHPFIPHITIGYVSEDFDEKKLMYNGLKEVRSARIEYYSH
jgi:2'-5' RNA ligase